MSEVTPTHIGFILDGNRRWAKQKSLSTLEGHREGSDNFRRIAMTAFQSGVQYVTGYIFSNENWQRTEEEVGYLMKLVIKAIEDYLEMFHKDGIRIVVLGRQDGLRSKVRNAIRQAEEKTRHNTRGTLALCFNYSGHDEIVDAFRAINGSGNNFSSLDAQTLRKYLYHPEIPDIDLLIRTSGEQRLSGFMLWRAAYSELYFSDKYWPDFDDSDLDVAINWYKTRERRFGS